MQRVGMNQHRLNQDELLRISRAISDTTRYALLDNPDLAGADSCPLSAFGSHPNGQLRTRSAFSFSAADCFGFTRN
jgi:hypothetical protein